MPKRDFSCKFANLFSERLLLEHLWTAASVLSKTNWQSSTNQLSWSSSLIFPLTVISTDSTTDISVGAFEATV